VTDKLADAAESITDVIAVATSMGIDGQISNLVFNLDLKSFQKCI